MNTEQELARLLCGILLCYPVDPTQRDKLWGCIVCGLNQPQPAAAEDPP